LSHAASIRRAKYDKENLPAKKKAAQFSFLACEKTTKLQVREKSKHIPGTDSEAGQREEKSNIRQMIKLEPTIFW
jgi:hypothetical protein